MIVEDLIEVENIISHRFKDDKIEYEIKLCGYDKLEWVKIDFFESEQKNLIEDYHKKHQLDSNGQIIINVKSKNEKVNITKKIKTVTSNKPKKIPIIKKEIMISEKETILSKKECSTKATLPISTWRSDKVETIESCKSSNITTISSKSTVEKVLSSQLIVSKDNINKTNKECSRKRGHSVQKSQLGNEINQCKETNDKTTQENVVKKGTIPVCTIKPIFKQNDLSSPIKRIKLTKSIHINNEVAPVKKIWLFANTPPTIDNLTVIIVQNESQEFDKIVKSHHRDIVAQMVKENPDLLVKAVANNNVKICNSLLCLGANINEGDSSGTTALVAAFNKEYETIIDLLIKKGVDINIDSNGRNEMLKKCITNNNVNMFKLLLTANPDYSQIEHLITDKTSSIATVLEDHKKRILEYLDIKIRSFNYQFYKDIMELMYSNNDVKIIFLDQTTIPPNLKTNRLSRKMVLFSCVTPKSYTIDQIIEGPLEGAFDIHVANNEGQLVANYEGKRLVTMLQTNKTYYINEEDAAAWKFSLRPNKDPEQCAFICALELFTKKVTETKSLNEKSTDYGYTYNPSEDDFRQRLSFIRKPLSLQEIRSRIIFIDVHLRKTMSRRWTPVQLAILNYGGDVLLNTLICPRERLLRSSDWGYNITDEDVRGQLDEEEAKKLTRKITENKILVGHHLNSVIENLDLNKEALCGLRDLSNAPVIRKLTLDNHQFKDKDQFNDNNQFIGLNNITKKLSIEGALWYPKLKASTILTIYKAVESEWEDDVKINKENIKDCFKNEISSSHSRNENIFTAFSNIKDIQGTKNEDLSNNKMNIKENGINNEKVNKIETIIRAKEKEVAAEECKDTLISDGRRTISAVNNKLNEEREAGDTDQRNESIVIIKDNEGIKQKNPEDLHNQDKNKANDIKIMNKEELNIKNRELCVVGAPSFNENMIKHVSTKKIYIKVDENRSVNDNTVQATISITKCDDKIAKESSDKSKDYVSKKVHDLNSKMVIKRKDSSSANDHNLTLKSNECIKENHNRKNRSLSSQNMKMCIKNIEPDNKKESNTCDENGVLQNKSTNKHRSTSRINSRRSSTHMTHTRSRSRNRTGSKSNKIRSKSHKRIRSRSKSRKKDRYRSKSRKRDRSISNFREKISSRNRSISVNNKSSRLIETKNVSSTDRIHIKCNGEKERGKDDHALRNYHNNKCKSVTDFKDCVVASKSDDKDECNISSTKQHNKTFIATNQEKDAKELHNKDQNKTISLSSRDDINYRHKKNCAVLNDKGKTEIHRCHDDQTIKNDHHFKIKETRVEGKDLVSLERSESLHKLNDGINNKNKKDSSAILTNKNILVKDNKVLDNDHGRCMNDRNDRESNIFTRMKEMQVKIERKLLSHNNNNNNEDRTLKMGILSLNSPLQKDKVINQNKTARLPEESFCVTTEHNALCSLKDNITFNTI